MEKTEGLVLYNPKINMYVQKINNTKEKVTWITDIPIEPENISTQGSTSSFSQVHKSCAVVYELKPTAAMFFNDNNAIEEFLNQLNDSKLPFDFVVRKATISSDRGRSCQLEDIETVSNRPPEE